LLAIGGAAGAVLNLVAIGLLLALGVEGGDPLSLLLLAFFCVGTPLAVSACGVLAVVRIRRSDGWLYGLPVAAFAALCFPLMLTNGLLIGVVLALDEIGLFIVAGLAFLAGNGVAVWYVSKLVSVGYQRATGGV
jgi:hypothetical protein